MNTDVERQGESMDKYVKAVELSRSQQALIDGVWKMINDYADSKACPVNGPDPELAARREILKFTLENIIVRAVA